MIRSIVQPEWQSDATDTVVDTNGTGAGGGAGPQCDIVAKIQSRDTKKPPLFETQSEPSPKKNNLARSNLPPKCFAKPAYYNVELMTTAAGLNKAGLHTTMSSS